MSSKPNESGAPQRPQSELPTGFTQSSPIRAWVQLARAYTKVQHRMSHVFSRHGLTSAKFDVLATLHRGEGIMQQELASRLLVTKGNVCGVLDRLEAAGWIERRADPEDRRANLLYLTEAGRTVFAETIPEHHAVIQEMMADFQPGEIQMLQRLLQTLEAGIEN